MSPAEILTILSTAEKLKCNTRHCDTSTGRRESVAEHSWRLSLLAMLVMSELKKEFPDLDGDKVIRMCIIHDLGEAFTGDIPTFLKTDADETNEGDILAKWVDGFPEPERSEWQALYREMNALETVEARSYKALDKMEAVIQHNESALSSWLPLEYELQFNYGRENVQYSAFMRAFKEEVDRQTAAKIESGV